MKANHVIVATLILSSLLVIAKYSNFEKEDKL